MSEALPCPDCDHSALETTSVPRRDFLRVVGGSAVALTSLQAVPRVLGDDPAPAAPPRSARPAEALVRELYSTLTDAQKGQVVRPYDHRANANATLTRHRMYNAALGRRIGDVYTRPQQELVERILRSISSDDEGYRRITRNGTFDGSQNLQACGADIFGTPEGNTPFAWVFSGHHLTVRCDGNSEPGTAFGGPMYYGHSPDGYSQRNCFFYQTRSVLGVFDALSEAQRRQAVVAGSPGELEPSIRFRERGQTHPGIAARDLTRDQRQLVTQVMRDVLSPYRREDADEVMEIVGRNGGLDRLHLAFYRDEGAPADQHWHFWRIEGPGFVWNYRVLPHVHTYVHIATQA